MSNAWPIVRLGEALIERREAPSADDLTFGRVRIVSKISFDTGQIELRTGSETNTGMILARPGDLVISGINAAKGAVAIYEAQNTGPIAATIHYGAYRPKPDRADIKFLWWFFRSRFFRELLTQHVPGGIKTELKSKRLLPIPVPLPPLAEQRRVVVRIEELAAQIQEAHTLRHQAAEEADAILPTARHATISQYRSETVVLEDVCAAIIDNLHSNPRLSETGIPCVRSPDVGWGTLNLDGAQRTDEAEFRRRTVRGTPGVDDIVLVREGGGTGKCALVQPDLRFSLGQRVMMLRPNSERIVPRFFLHQLLSPLVQDQIAPLSKGSASPHLNIGALRRFNLILPSLPEQRWIVAELDALQAEMGALKRLQADTATELDALLPSVLDRAFKGEL
ncbi:MAG: restriction endonuclease subunit S [Gammaproteobacteria bacterium]|nr:restriction endonuclease subunit S [Gammaproteobacteria bacterium]